MRHHVWGPAEYGEHDSYESAEANAAQRQVAEAFTEELRNEGSFVYVNGLTEASVATVVDGRADTPIFTDGPYLESKEYIAGFWVVRAADLDAALALATRASQACQRKIEVRPAGGRWTCSRSTPPSRACTATSGARVVASLMRRFGNLDLAEEVAADAFAAAVERWRSDGLPPNPGAWIITTTATRNAIDRLRREGRRDAKHQEAAMLNDVGARGPTSAVEDDRLRLIFTCCHPALAIEARVALTLRMVGGLDVPEIARAFLVQQTTMGQRISRAKTKIREAGIPFRIPDAEVLPARLDAVLTVLYLVFTEGYLATGENSDPIRRELTAEAIRLARLVRDLAPDSGEAAGLLALMLLTDARAPSRVSASGELVRLDEQDRGAWNNRDMIVEGIALVRERVAAVADGGLAPGRFQLLAAINAVHVSAPHTGHPTGPRSSRSTTSSQRSTR
jgi:RNA polymerase sigma-70 factor (ECF subfamily)